MIIYLFPYNQFEVFTSFNLVCSQDVSWFHTNWKKCETSS